MRNPKHGRIYLNLVLLILLLTPAAAKGVSSQTISSSTQVFVNPGSAAAKTCSALTIAVSVSNVENLVGYHLELNFDPAIVAVTGVLNGDFLAGETLEEPGNVIDNEAGFISFGLTLFNSISDPIEPASGTGDLVLITLQVVDVNQSTEFTIDPESSMLVDWPDAFEIPFSVSNGTVVTETCAPTDILLSNSSVLENMDIGTHIGQFSSIDPDSDDTHTYSLVGDYPGNSAFTISGDDLVSSSVFDYDQQSAYTIKVRSTDSGGQYFEKEFTITILKDSSDDFVNTYLPLILYPGN